MSKSGPIPADDAKYEVNVLVTRGDELPKKNYEKKKHPTYETSIRIKSTGSSRIACQPHTVVKFFNQYRDLHDQLLTLGIGENKAIHIAALYPPTHTASIFGSTLNEEQLQQRCYLLNKWMQGVFAQFHLFPPEAVKVVSDFLSINDDDFDSEANKDLILNLMRRKAETESVVPPPPVLSTTAPPPRPTDAPTPPPGYRTSTYSVGQRRVSTYTIDKVSLNLNAQELEDYNQEALINHFLAVSVMRGEMIPKSEEDSKLHQSYEAIIRVLPLHDCSYPYAADVDETAYHNLTSFPPISVMKVFDRYRALKTQLEETGVFCKENERGIKDYNDGIVKATAQVQQSNNSNGNSNPEEGMLDTSTSLLMAKVVDAPFPRTLAKSSIGLSLTDQQLYERTALLNHWLGLLLKSFNILPPRAQELIMEFFELTYYPATVTDKLLSAGDNDADGPAEGDGSQLMGLDHSALILAILRSKFVPPKKVEESHHSLLGTNNKKDKHGKKEVKDKKSSGKEAGNNSNSDVVIAPVTAASLHAASSSGKFKSHNKDQASDSSSAAEGEEDDEVGNLPNISTARPHNIHSGQSDVSGSTTMSQQMSAEMQYELMKEIVIYHFLGVTVKVGDKITKGNSSTGKLHQGYQVTLRILPYDEVIYPDKAMMDVDQYNALYANNDIYTTSTSKVFDAYRVLKENLESRFSIYCHNEVPNNIDADKRESLIVVEASFPKTYRRSQFGFKLSGRQIMERGANLNHWLGILLSKFHVLPTDAQEYLTDFFNIDPHDPAEPQNKVFTQLLLRKFTPPMKVIVDVKKGAANKKKKHDEDGNVVSSYSYGGTNTARGDIGDEEEEGKRMAAANACCTIM